MTEAAVTRHSVVTTFGGVKMLPPAPSPVVMCTESVGHICVLSALTLPKTIMSSPVSAAILLGSILWAVTM